jgi:hypothetical protein
LIAPVAANAGCDRDNDAMVDGRVELPMINILRMGFGLSLIWAERTHRQARSISYRIGGAKFPVLKDIDTFAFPDTPIDEGQVRELATGAFLGAKRNAIFIGGTGTV